MSNGQRTADARDPNHLRRILADVEREAVQQDRAYGWWSKTNLYRREVQSRGMTRDAEILRPLANLEVVSRARQDKGGIHGFAEIMIEELSEAIRAKTHEERFVESVQLAALAIGMAQAALEEMEDEDG